MVGRGHHTHVRLTSTKTCLVAARMRARTPARDWFTKFVATLEITPREAYRHAPVQLHLDRSGRVTVPVWLRNRISEPLVMSLWHRNIRVWSISAFDALVERFQKHMQREPAQRNAMRGFLASSASTRFDERGRLYVPERFRTSCGIGIVVVLQPTDDGFELGPLE